MASVLHDDDDSVPDHFFIPVQIFIYEEPVEEKPTRVETVVCSMTVKSIITTITKVIPTKTKIKKPSVRKTKKAKKKPESLDDILAQLPFLQDEAVKPVETKSNIGKMEARKAMKEKLKKKIEECSTKGERILRVKVRSTNTTTIEMEKEEPETPAEIYARHTEMFSKYDNSPLSTSFTKARKPTPSSNLDEEKIKPTIEGFSRGGSYSGTSAGSSSYRVRMAKSLARALIKERASELRNYVPPTDSTPMPSYEESMLVMVDSFIENNSHIKSLAKSYEMEREECCSEIQEQVWNEMAKIVHDGNILRSIDRSLVSPKQFYEEILRGYVSQSMIDAVTDFECAGVFEKYDPKVEPLVLASIQSDAQNLFPQVEAVFTLKKMIEHKLAPCNARYFNPYRKRFMAYGIFWSMDPNLNFFGGVYKGEDGKYSYYWVLYRRLIDDIDLILLPDRNGTRMQELSKLAEGAQLTEDILMDADAIDKIVDAATIKITE